MISPEPESAGGGNRITETPEKRPETPNAEGRGPRRLASTRLAGRLVEKVESSPCETLFVTNLIQVAVRASSGREENAGISRLWKF
jgi:hypothetical protein